MTDPCLTQKQAVDLLQYHLQYFWNFQETSIPFWNEMNDNQRGCLLSFSFNCGAAFYGNSGFNTISACLRERRWPDVPAALMLYVNPGSAAEVGLKRRRRAEGELWIK
jgi:GH24 family phage-related lysozyme (muramidase)